jgi:hypothetical protein
MSVTLHLCRASYRAQVLARTVRGMEAYQKALRVLAAIEVPPSPGRLSRPALFHVHSKFSLFQLHYPGGSVDDSNTPAPDMGVAPALS